MAALIQGIHLNLLAKARKIDQKCLSFLVYLNSIETELIFDKYEKNVNEIKKIIEELREEANILIREI